MKTIFAKAALAIAALALTFSLASCDRGNGATGPVGDEFEDALFYINEAVVEDAEVVEASIENEMDIPEYGEFAESMRPDRRDNDRKPPKRHHFLGRVLRSLDLTDEQKAEVRILLEENRDCVREAKAALWEARMEIIRAANEERRAVIESYRNGEIERDAAVEQIKAINQAAREELRGLQELAEVTRAAIEDCNKALFDAIGQILDEEQLEKWNAFLERLGLL